MNADELRANLKQWNFTGEPQTVRYLAFILTEIAIELVKRTDRWWLIVAGHKYKWVNENELIKSLQSYLGNMQQLLKRKSREMVADSLRSSDYCWDSAVCIGDLRGSCNSNLWIGVCYGRISSVRFNRK